LPWVGSGRWKRRAIYLTRMKFYFQAKKALIRSRFCWYKFYAVRGYGAPGSLEFICPYTGMTAKTIEQDQAASIQVYWLKCHKRSIEVVDWLDSIDESRYNSIINSFLLRLIVTDPPILSEVTRYERLYPFTPFDKTNES
jgi:hypothetical protein